MLEWKAAMANMPPAIHNGAERRAENLSTHDLERMIDTAFRQAMLLRDAPPEELQSATHEALRAFDQLCEHYGKPPQLTTFDPMTPRTQAPKTAHVLIPGAARTHYHGSSQPADGRTPCAM